MHYWGQSESVGFCVRYLCVCVCVYQMMQNSLDRCSLRSIRGSRSSASCAPRRKIHWPVHYRSSEIWSVNFTFHRLQRQSRSMTTERLLQVNTHLRSCAFPLGALVRFFPFFPPTRSAALEVDFFNYSQRCRGPTATFFFPPSGREIYNLLIKKRGASSQRAGGTPTPLTSPLVTRHLNTHVGSQSRTSLCRNRQNR